MRISWLITAVTCVGTVAAQRPPADRTPAATLAGSVAGHITFAETRLPARFVEVILVHRPTDAELKPSVEDRPPPPRRGARPFPAESTQVVSISGRSGMDGSFRIDGVPAGEYLLLARVRGYAVTGAPAQSASVQQQIASLPTVHVSVGQTASADLTLAHGGVLGGRVQFADGSPVIGGRITVQPSGSQAGTQAAQSPPYLPLQNAQREDDRLGLFPATDDEGRYRLSGLLPGKYLIFTRIETDRGAAQVFVGDQHSLSQTQSGGDAQPMTVYQPGVFRRKEARVFEIRADEQVLDADIKVDPSGLHTIRGRLIAGEDRHAPRQATVQLRESDATDSEDMGHLAQTAPDGSFQIRDVPSGSYLVQVAFATDQDLSQLAEQFYPGPLDPSNEDGPDIVTSTRSLTHLFKSPKIPVLLGDHDLTLDDIVLTPFQPGSDSTPAQPQ